MKLQLRSLLFLLPRSRLKNRLLRLTGCELGSDVAIGPNLVVGVGDISIGSHSRIGSFNVLRSIGTVRFGEHCHVGQWNWFTAAVGPHGSTLSVGDHSAVTSRHYVDTTGGITIGRFSTVAGGRSSFWTHGIDWRTSSQQARPVVIGDYCLIGAGVTVAPGTIVPDRCVVGAGTSLAGEDFRTGTLIVAERGRSVTDIEGAYFSRAVGYVDPVDAAR